MSTDIELLKLAAKAAFTISPDLAKSQEWWDGFLSQWNPLHDDAQALRLAVGLGCARVLEFECGPAGICATFHHPEVEADEFQRPGEDFDPYAATRRAIVRAAAAIGRQMP